MKNLLKNLENLNNNEIKYFEEIDKLTQTINEKNIILKNLKYSIETKEKENNKLI